MPALPEVLDRPTLSASPQTPFFRIPPFPGSRIRDFVRLPQALDTQILLSECVALARESRVGGAYWASQPTLPPHYLLVRSAAALPSCDNLIQQHGGALLWVPVPATAVSEWPTFIGECDPWHMLAGAGGLVCDSSDEARLVATTLGVPTYLIDPQGGPPQRRAGDDEMHLAGAMAEGFANPFTGNSMSLPEVIELCGYWRSLIDSNRTISRGVGFAFWKQESVLPLLWGGGDSSAFFRNAAGEDPKAAVAIWRSKAPPGVVEKLELENAPLIEVEDGFLRSRGLGADCIPPLSITVDRLGPYFDPGQPSELENLLQHGYFEPSLIERAIRLRTAIVAAGLGKYDRGDAIIDRLDDKKLHILVPGQVEDDRSVLAGGSGLVSNLDLLKRVRARKPDSYLIYKPHPDVVAGHRKGGIPDDICLQFADKVMSKAPISSLIGMVDEVHVNTSLAGFEALMRHKNVTTYGVPFYAGWGLTSDLGPVPARRTAKRSLDEMVAATLLIYPRYLDPMTGLPCPAEIVVDRLCADELPKSGFLVAVRRIQGKLRRSMQRFAP